MNSLVRQRRSLPSERLAAARDAAENSCTLEIFIMTMSSPALSMTKGEIIVWKTAKFFARLAMWLRREVEMSLESRRLVAIEEQIAASRNHARY